MAASPHYRHSHYLGRQHRHSKYLGLEGGCMRQTFLFALVDLTDFQSALNPALDRKELEFFKDVLRKGLHGSEFDQFAL